MGGYIKKIITNIISTIVLITSAIVFIGSFIVYEKTGYFGFHWEVLKYILASDIQYLLGIIVLLLVIIYAITMYYRKVLAERKNCQVTYVDLSTIAVNWVKFENIEENIKEKFDSKAMSEFAQAVYSENEDTINRRYHELFIQNSKDLIDNFVFPNAKRFDINEINIIYDLLLLLEENVDFPSVASLYDKDPEIMIYNSRATITSDGKTSYDILKTYTLYNHTLRVANIALETNDQIGQSINKYSMLGRLIITVLSHDIGKITASQNKTKINGQIFHQQPHEMISAMMIREMYPEYKNIEQIVKAIKAHHGGKQDDSLSVALKEADKKAREVEINEWHITNKLNKEQKENENKNINKTDDNETLMVQLDNVIDVEVLKNKEPEKQRLIVDDFFAEAGLTPLSVEKEKQVEGKNKEVEAKEDTPVDQKNKKIKKIKNLEFEYDFIEAHGQEIKEYLQKNINKTKTRRATGVIKIVSISYRDVVFFEYSFFKDMLQNVFEATLNDNALNMIFRQLKEADIVAMINVEENYKVSKITIVNSKKTENLPVVPIKIDFLGYTLDETEQLKKENPFLKNTVVELYL